MRVGFTGTQHGMTALQRAALRGVLDSFARPRELHHGDCIGADSEAHTIGLEIGYTLILHPPVNPHKRAWRTGDIEHPSKEYLARNEDIVRASEVLVACPKEFTEQLRSGTWATIRAARKAGKRVIIVRPDGELA